MSTSAKIIGIFVVLVLGAGIFYSMNLHPDALSSTGTSTAPTEDTKSQGSIWDTIVSFVQKPFQKNSDTAKTDANQPKAPEVLVPYSNPDFKFTIQIPNSLTEHNIPDKNGSLTILFKSDDKNKNFQIRASSFDEPPPLTAARVKKALPDMMMDQPEDITIGDGIPALSFYSQDASLDDSKEIWFVANGHLYQISGYANSESWLMNILASWKFN